MSALQEMVQYAYDNTVYYKRSFDEAGVAPSDIKTLKDLEKFPFIDKKTERETQHVGTFFGEMCSVPEEDVIFMATSSGSTGVPTVSPFTQEDFDLWQDTEARLFWQAGMRPTDRYVHGLNFALYVGGPDVIGAQRLGALAIWVGAVPSDRLIFVLQQYQPTVIWTSPSYAWTLGEKIKEKGLDPRTDFSIHTIIVAGEPGGSIKSTREAIENLWDAKVVDFFGLSDIYGACAAACEAHDGLHIVEDQILVETVDPATGEVLAPGEVGELVYTTLMKKARPMIRFRTGDIGYFSTEKCECGRTLGRIHITGRKDEMFIVGAVNVFPSDVEYVVRGREGAHRRVPHPRVRRELLHPLRGVRGARPGLRRALRRRGRPRDGGVEGAHRCEAGARHRLRRRQARHVFRAQGEPLHRRARQREVGNERAIRGRARRFVRLSGIMSLEEIPPKKGTCMTSYDFAISGQHYLFDVQSFAHTILAAGGDAFSYALLDRTTQGVIDDVASGAAELGVIMQTSDDGKRPERGAGRGGAGLPRAGRLRAARGPAVKPPLREREELTLEQLADFPYVYFDQGEDAPIAFFEEALSQVPRAKKVACTDRASLTELIMAINGYTVTSGILVGITDGSALTTIPLETDLKLHLGYVTADNRELSVMGERFVSHLARSLDLYANR